MRCSFLTEDKRKKLLDLFEKLNKEFNDVKLHLPLHCRNDNECSSFSVKVGGRKNTTKSQVFKQLVKRYKFTATLLMEDYIKQGEGFDYKEREEKFLFIL